MTPPGASDAAIRARIWRGCWTKATAAPGAIGHYRRKLTGVQIGCFSGDVFKAALAARCVQHTEKSFRLINSNDASGRTHELSKIQVKHIPGHNRHPARLSGADPGRAPRVRRTLAPRAVLQTKPLDLFVVRAQHIVFRGNHAHPPREALAFGFEHRGAPQAASIRFLRSNFARRHFWSANQDFSFELDLRGLALGVFSGYLNPEFGEAKRIKWTNDDLRLLCYDKKLAGALLGDRGECARCRNGDLIMRRCIVRFCYEDFLNFPSRSDL